MKPYVIVGLKHCGCIERARWINEITPQREIDQFNKESISRGLTRARFTESEIQNAPWSCEKCHSKK